jgi:hypothetical protein
MMTARDEEAAVRRATTLAQARRLCSAWAYWCMYGRIGDIGGRWPDTHSGGIEKRYKAPPQWHPPGPRLPEADENVGLAVQRAFIEVPDVQGFRYRTILRVEFCVRPWLIGTKDGEIESLVARKARVSTGAYDMMVEKAMMSLVNVMKRKGSWRE